MIYEGMAVSNPEYSFSRFLFLFENGQPITFYMRPCDERQRLRPFIEHGGGRVTSKLTRYTIKLVDSISSVSSDDYILTDFIDDSIKANKLLDMDKYRVGRRSFQSRLKVGNKIGRSPNTKTLNQTSSSMSSEDELNEDDMAPANHIVRIKATERKGRTKYTLEEDRQIIEFLISTHRYGEAKGMAVWMDMQRQQVTPHTGQSMSTRFRKFILPNIRSYHVPRDWVARLTGQIQSETQDNDTVEVTPRHSPSKTTSTNNRLSLDSDGNKNEEIQIEQFPSPTATPKANSILSGSSGDVDEFDQILINAAMQAEEIDVQSLSDTHSHKTRSNMERNNNMGTEAEQIPSRNKKNISSIHRMHKRIILNDSITSSDSDKESQDNTKKMWLRSRNGLSPSKKLKEELIETANTTDENSGSEKKENSTNKLSAASSRQNSSEMVTAVHVSILPTRKQNIEAETPNTKNKPVENSVALEQSTSSPLKKIGRLNGQTIISSVDQKKEEGKSKKLKTNFAEDNGTSRKIDYVMDVDDIDSQPASLSQQNSTLTDSEKEEIDPHELKKHIDIVKKYCSEFGLTPKQFLHCLWANNGVVEDAVFWIKYGTNREGFPAWELEDEQNLIANKNMNRLRAKFGLKNVSEHALMLEDD